jgi:hypothetical protein
VGSRPRPRQVPQDGPARDRRTADHFKWYSYIDGCRSGIHPEDEAPGGRALL